MKNKFYSVQFTSSDAWDNGSADYDTAVAMLRKQGAGLIAVIDTDNDYCEKEITFDDLFDMRDFSDDELAEIVASADKWDRPGCMEAMNELCDRAGKKLRDMIDGGDDCAEIFDDLRHSVENSDEFFAETPDVSKDTPDMIDWLRDGGEQADLLRLAYVVENILGIALV